MTPKGVIAGQKARPHAGKLRGRLGFLGGSRGLVFLLEPLDVAAVSISFCRPVKNGWQEEQISTRISPLCVERVLNVWPQAQVTLISL